MLNNNEDLKRYVVYGLCFSQYLTSLTPWYVKNDTEERNARAKKAYSALLIVTARTPNNDEYQNFSIDVSINA